MAGPPSSNRGTGSNELGRSRCPSADRRTVTRPWRRSDTACRPASAPRRSSPLGDLPTKGARQVPAPSLERAGRGVRSTGPPADGRQANDRADNPCRRNPGASAGSHPSLCGTGRPTNDARRTSGTAPGARRCSCGPWSSAAGEAWRARSPAARRPTSDRAASGMASPHPETRSSLAHQPRAQPSRDEQDRRGGAPPP